MPEIAYLGPPGTFTEQATRLLTADFDAELVPCETVPVALAAVRSGEVLAAGVPVENSVEGSVPATLDALTEDDPLIAVKEVVIPVQFDVFAQPGMTLGEVGTVASHPHALAQVRGWLAEALPKADVRAVSSTAAAAAAVADGEYDAAISAPVAGEHYSSLQRLATGIADVRDAVTRFLLVRRPGTLPEPTGADRTSICAVIGDEVGTLSDMLAELSLRGINLSRIESRPVKDHFGHYRFYLDFDGHVADARIGEAMAALQRRCDSVRFLGSYPKADRKPASVRPGSSEQAFRNAAEWLAAVRAGRLA
ncbi:MULTISPECIES: prephenate dehydratase [Saccharopolyspora]|uniref:Prephenate dehydratase n=2 Tax=Saccharopolyspora TaxID=1835 RepID=A0A4R4VQ70_9PSEU|nr:MULTISPECIES: prephenate dehydratase [Saccharopolyspora]MBQ0928743.1 prephenate dehydratase [Saccharopolyspora endophytica]TDD08039.1 prephenate dehydratase [Saccharopolyspora terrae]